jgi:hypothetical protein
MRATASGSADRADRRSAEPATLSAPAMANRAETPERWSTADDSRRPRVKRAMTSRRWAGTVATSADSWAISETSSETSKG